LQLDEQRRELGVRLLAAEAALARSGEEVREAEDENLRPGDPEALAAGELRALLVGETKRTATRLQTRSRRLSGQSRRLVDKAAEAHARASTLEVEAERLRSEQRIALGRMREQAAARRSLAERIAALVVLMLPPAVGGPIVELATAVGEDWASAWSMVEARERAWRSLEVRRDDLFRDLTNAERTLAWTAQEAGAAEREFYKRDEERRARDRLANEELAAARAEHKMLRQAQAEWMQRRPNLAQLIEELRFGNREGTATYNELVDRLAHLQASVQRRTGDARAAAEPAGGRRRRGGGSWTDAAND